jgi:hypothetical protein
MHSSHFETGVEHKSEGTTHSGILLNLLVQAELAPENSESIETKWNQTFRW